ncbi:hypothetical protein MASR1M6_11640 [Rubrivivax sp.]
MAGITLAALEPQDAVAVFAARGLLRPSFRWQDVWQAEHARAFAVAGVMRLDVLRMIRDHVEAAVRDGSTFAEFEAAVRERLVARGFWGNVQITDPETGEIRTTRFNQQRLSLIFDVNMRQSHSAGRWARIQRSRTDTHIVYRTMRDERVRLSHRPWDNLVLPKTDPWWDTHFPPNGWRCRCMAFGIDERGIERMRADPAASVKTQAPPTTWVEFTNRSTGATERVPHGVDPGFAYNPGKVHVQRGMEHLVREVQALPPLPAAGAGDALRTARALVARGRREAAFADFLATPPAGVEVSMPVAAVPALPGEPLLAAVGAPDLVRQAKGADWPRPLPTVVADWALAQAVVDRGQRFDLGGGRVLWWWLRGRGDAARVHVLELERGLLVWAVRELSTLSADEAGRRYPGIAQQIAAQVAQAGG